MPIEPHKPGDFPESVEWEVRMLINDPDIDPLLITFRRYYSGDVKMNVTSISGDSLSKQVSIILKTNPDAKLLEVANNINLINTEIDNNCFDLSQLSEEFEQLKSNTVLNDELISHPIHYNIITESRVNYIHISYRGPGTRALSQEYPIIEWVEKIRGLINQDCMKPASLSE